jgi:hypothetical protein
MSTKRKIPRRSGPLVPSRLELEELYGVQVRVRELAKYIDRRIRKHYGFYRPRRQGRRA